MTWLRMTDKAHADARVLAMGNSAFGSFVRCAAWAGDQLSDGHVPAAVARMYGSPKDIDKITAAGLWQPTPDPDGFMIVSFLDSDHALVSCRSREAVESDRRQAKERQQKRRHGHVTDASQRDNSVSHGPPDPTRPDPTPPTPPAPQLSTGLKAERIAARAGELHVERSADAKRPAGLARFKANALTAERGDLLDELAVMDIELDVAADALLRGERPTDPHDPRGIFITGAGWCPRTEAAS